MRKPARVLLTGGGTGGHIIPNLAVASTIKNRQPDVVLLYVASRSKLDAELLGRSAIPYRTIFSGKLRRYFSWRNFVDPFFLFIGFLQSLFILLQFRPKVIFSKGGYVSLPVVLAARILRYPVILHESDSRMGLANRIASQFATVVCVAFPNLVRKNKKYRLTGNPIRPEIMQGKAEEGYRLTGFKKGPPVLLVWGGSQGSAEINNMIEKDFEKFTAYFQVVHITGTGNRIRQNGPHYIAFEYLDEELKHVYAMTDLVIGRAGANSLYELVALRKPNIIVPLGNADQVGNAHFFETRGAAVVYKKGDELFDLTLRLWQNQDLQTRMKKALAGISSHNANTEIAKLILDL